MQDRLDEKAFDMMLGRYCGPALAGIKPANMICIKKNKLPQFEMLLQDYNSDMNKHDIYFLSVNETETSYLLLVYRRKKLEEHLNDTEVREQLTTEGYCDTANIESLLFELRTRFSQSDSLPCEIGLFLGYPIGDVKGFRENNGKNCLMTRYWKVYADVDVARQLFDRYDKCRYAICARLSEGRSIVDMFSRTVA